MRIPKKDIKTLIAPLRLIFWGGLICLFDLSVSQTVNNEGWTFDFLNDFVGMLMITEGVYQLARVNSDDRYRTRMTFVKVVAVLSCLDALHDHFIYDTPILFSFLLLLLGFAAMFAIVLFCLAMGLLSREFGLGKSERSWRTTTWCFVLIYLIPIGVFYLAAAVAIVAGSSFNIDLGPGGLLLMPVLCIPLIHFFVSTSRMKAEAESSADWLQ